MFGKNEDYMQQHMFSTVTSPPKVVQKRLIVDWLGINAFVISKDVVCTRETIICQNEDCRTLAAGASSDRNIADSVVIKNLSVHL